jgi:hypothetical protein
LAIRPEHDADVDQAHLVITSYLLLAQLLLRKPVLSATLTKEIVVAGAAETAQGLTAVPALTD